MKKILLAAAVVGAAVLIASAPADAQRWRGGGEPRTAGTAAPAGMAAARWHGGGIAAEWGWGWGAGAGFAAGALVGGALAAPYYYGPGYYAEAVPAGGDAVAYCSAAVPVLRSGLGHLSRLRWRAPPLPVTVRIR